MGTRIHSYLCVPPRSLVAARDLLTDSGSIFLQIGDENIHLVRSLMDEIFGSENFCSLDYFRQDRAIDVPNCCQAH